VERTLPSMPAMKGVTPNQLTLAKVDPTELDYWTLKKRIAELEAAGRPVDEARAGLAHKIAGPLSTLLMPLLAAVAAFGLARSGQVLLRAPDAREGDDGCTVREKGFWDPRWPRPCPWRSAMRRPRRG